MVCSRLEVRAVGTEWIDPCATQLWKRDVLLSWSPPFNNRSEKRGQQLFFLYPLTMLFPRISKDRDIHPTSGALWTGGPRPKPRALCVLYRLCPVQRGLKSSLCSACQATQAKSTQNKGHRFPVCTKAPKGPAVYPLRPI